MLLLSVPSDRLQTPGRPADWPAAFQIAAASLALMVVGLALERAGGFLGPMSRALTSGAVHAGFFGLGWVLGEGGRPGWRGPVIRLGATVVVASLASRVVPWGAIAYLAVPAVLLVEVRRRGGFGHIGFTCPNGHAVGLGVAAGLFLGVHLIVTASLTLGYAVRMGSTAAYLSAIAYDICVSAVTVEWLFRGAIFSWAWRSWEFVPAAALATALAVVRYLVDPNLPATPEVWLGSAFYTALVGVSACVLRAWSGSLLPGYLATVTFFLAYRALGN